MPPEKADKFYVNQKLARIDRTIGRLEDCNAITDDNFHSLRDAFIEFCTHCYHLKDTMSKSGFAPRADVEEYVAKSYVLTICGNVANKDKHHKRRPGEEREPRLPAFAGELIPIVRSWNPWEHRAELELDVDRRGYNCLQFAHNARGEWARFIKDREG